MSLWLFWLIVIVLLSIIEFMTINLVTIWFVASGILALISSFFISDILIQATIFVIGGLLLVIVTKPILAKLNKSSNNKLDLERIIGSTGIVTQEIRKNVVGEVKADGKHWSAVSERKIPVDSEVIIEAIDGVKLLVKKKEAEITLEKEENKKEKTKSKSKKKSKKKIRS